MFMMMERFYLIFAVLDPFKFFSFFFAVVDRLETLPVAKGKKLFSRMFCGFRSSFSVFFSLVL